ncbi:UDP-4-amino-4,6-dideoxy-N-acetyl-beta-L-altrosamine N-acetyltransferase, partial [Campylobacter lari]|nr:UDP-4-amino-4,6-dideoxy-N-acetyl-beta-L-altrosamine N-acetyltransferase [Campylobacter lari]
LNNYYWGGVATNNSIFYKVAI